MLRCWCWSSDMRSDFVLAARSVRSWNSLTASHLFTASTGSTREQRRVLPMQDYAVILLRPHVVFGMGCVADVAAQPPTPGSGFT